jgi:hypothetical protein
VRIERYARILILWRTTGSQVLSHCRASTGPSTRGNRAYFEKLGALR